MSKVAHFKKHCEQIETDKVVCYCKFCTDAIIIHEPCRKASEFLSEAYQEAWH